MGKTTFKQKIILIVFGIFLCVITLEIGLRIGGFVFLALKEQHNNISFDKKHNEYRIMCLGESTTACGGENSYPSQLENILNNKKLKIRFKIINKAIPGNDSSIIVSHLNDNITKYAPDMIITMMGINDVPHRAASYEDVIPQKSYLMTIKDFRIYKLVKLILAHIKSKRERMIGLEFSKKIKK